MPFTVFVADLGAWRLMTATNPIDVEESARLEEERPLCGSPLATWPSWRLSWPRSAPATDTQVGDAQLQPLGARGSPELAVVCPLEDSGLVECSLQRHPDVAVRAAGLSPKWSAPSSGGTWSRRRAAKTRLTPTRWLTRSCTLQSVHGVGADHWLSRIPAIR